MEYLLQQQLFWVSVEQRAPDLHALFRGTFELRAEATVEVCASGASWFVLWLDGQYLLEGPVRFVPAHPEYDYRNIKLPAGKHTLAARLHDVGLATRMMPDTPPFFFASVQVEGRDKPLELMWKCQPLGGVHSQLRRINPQLGWVEWRDTRAEPEKWREVQFDDAKWQQPVAATTQPGEMKPRSIGPVGRIDHVLKPTARGSLAEAFGYELDDPAARFFLRDLEGKDVPPQGVWRRYDLGRVRLGRVSITMDVPAGAMIEIAASEQLRHGRVSPYITLSAGASCNMDHFIARGGAETFEPLTPKGGRFVEIHVLAPPDQIKFINEEYAERTYHGEPDGAFDCGDDLLNRIWMTGVETYRACAEDAIIDNPTRERGQWLGDAIVGGEIAAAAYRDLRLMRRNLLQTAQCAREDGLVPGMTTGGLIFLSTYAALFTPGCLRYFQLTGDRSLLEELWEPARKNLDAFEHHVHPAGLADDLAPAFVDWGFDRGAGPINIPLNLHYLSALGAMGQWCRLLEKNDRVDHYARREAQIRSAIAAVVDEFTKSKKPWMEFGYHSAALCLGHGFFAGDTERACVEYLKQHILSCFPNNSGAPHLSDPGVTSRQLITPYFAHFAFPPLIERGQMDFVLDQYRKCWGWALEDGRTTWLEVFDTRWSHCHQWSGCPTWQLSRYVLGLNPRGDRGQRHFDLRVVAGSLSRAQGKVPLSDGGGIDVAWKHEHDRVRYKLTTPQPIVLHIGDETIRVNDKFERLL